MILEVLCIFIYASGLGFGLLCTEGISVSCRFGVWNKEGDRTRYTYREFCNLVNKLEEVVIHVNLQGKEFFYARII